MDIPDWAFWGVVTLYGLFALAMFSFVVWMSVVSPMNLWASKNEKEDEPPT